jgi:hypothetical protein
LTTRKRIAVFGVMAMLLLAFGFAGGAYWAYRQVPEFYEESLQVDEQTQREANDELLAQATALASAARQHGKWSAAFTAEQINGWLAIDLPENYPGLLPGEVSAPRVKIAPGRATVACRYDDGKVSTVVSLDVEGSMPEPSVLALKIHKMRAGAIPLPLSKVLDGVAEAAASIDLPLEWRKSGGAPTAIIHLPPTVGDKGTQYILESLELQDGKLILAGHTAPSNNSARPLAPATAAHHGLAN